MHTRSGLLLAVAVLLACDGAGAPRAGGVAGSASLGAAGPAALAAPAAAAVATPADFLRLQPASTVVASADGTRLLHASGFSFDTGLARPADAAAAYLAAHAGAFGVTDRHALALRGPPPVDGVAAVRVQRAIDDLPVFGGDLVLGVTGGKVFLVNAADVPAAISGAHGLGAEQAGALALAAFRGGARGADLLAVTPGWKPLPGAVRAVYRVDFVAPDPEGSWRVFLDGETGQVLFAEDLRFHASAQGSAYEISPVETAAALCPLSGGVHTTCASPVAVTLDHLVGGANLTGTQTTVRNCRGGVAPTSSPASACNAVAAVSGRFQFPVETSATALSDDFSAVMAYYHLDRHVSFFKTLDPALPGGSGLALNGSLPALVNVTADGVARFDNAYYDGYMDMMVFGQGTSVDLAYDATVMYHELTHGVVEAWGGFAPNLDAMGGLDEPGAVNEGTADAMAASETGRSAMGAFVGPSLAGAAALRDMADPRATRTCKGSGTVVTQLGLSSVDGLDGEVHDDGEIWNGFYWEIYDGLRTAGVKGCGGACDAGPAIQYKALQLAAGAQPTFATYWNTMRSAASALFPAQPAVASYVECVARRRKLDQCDRTVPLYAGETKVEFVRLRYSPFQIAVTADGTGSAQIALCSRRGTSTTVWVRRNQPVQLSAVDPSTGNATIAADTHFSVSQACSGGTRALALPAAAAAATWYLLFDSPASAAASPGYDIYQVTASVAGVTRRPAASAPASCTPPTNGSTALTITPPSATVASGGSTTFTASGGSGTGYTWSLQANPSGGTITAAGVYTAGSTSAVVDVVRVVDSSGAAATASVTVTPAQLPPAPALAITPVSTTVALGGSATFRASGGSGAGYVWSLQASPSGGRIGADGVYTAGAVGGVTDVVKVVDAHGNTATAEVAVVAAAKGGGGSGGSKGGCASGGGAAGPLALLVAAVRLGRARRRARRAPEARA